MRIKLTESWLADGLIYSDSGVLAGRCGPENLRIERHARARIVGELDAPLRRGRDPNESAEVDFAFSDARHR